MTKLLQLNKQQKKLLHLLQKAGSWGVNSYDLRFIFHLIQAPVRVKELKEKGFLITTRQRKNRSVDYILVNKPLDALALFGKTPQQRQHRKCNAARASSKPIQLPLFERGGASG